jgi:hypothetical protein
MNSKLSLIVPALVLAASTAAMAANASGKWVAQVPGRDGQTREQTFNLKAEGDKLTGTVSGRQGDVAITDGKVKGDEVSFDVTMKFQDRDVKMTYKGKVEGDEIKFTRQREGSDRPAAAFTAKRAK